MTRTIRTWLILTVVSHLGVPLAVAAQGQVGEKTATPVAMAENVGAANTKLLPLAPDDYRIGINDILDVHVWRESELSRVIPVRPDGKIALPLVGELEAKGQTAVELSETITERLKTYVTAPQVTVIVQQINSQRYFVMGEVQRSGAYPLTVPITVMQALALAGGFREWADTHKITILRRLEDDRTMRITFNYKAWVKNKKVIDHLQMKNGDVIIVP